MNKDEEKDAREDVNRNGIDDQLEPPILDIAARTWRLADRLLNNLATDPMLSGGDIDARWEDAESGGDETVAGSTATPGQNDLDGMGKAIGVTYARDEELKAGEKERSATGIDGNSIRRLPKGTLTAREAGDRPHTSSPDRADSSSPMLGPTITCSATTTVGWLADPRVSHRSRCTASGLAS